MTPEQIFTRQLEAFGRGDLDEFLECWAPDCTFRDVTEPAARHGHGPLREYMAGYLRDLTELDTRIATLFGSGDHALAELVLTGTWRGEGAPPGGAPVTLNVCVVDVVREGLVRSETVYWDSRQLTDQLDAAHSRSASSASTRRGS